MAAPTPFLRQDKPRLRVAIASDHAALSLKRAIVRAVEAAGHAVVDLGTDAETPVDYPDYGYALAAALADGRAERGIALCGSGIGIAIAANRHPACRCAQVAEPLSARMARTHNDANAIALGSRMIGEAMAIACVEAFLSTEFEGGRHAARVVRLGTPPSLGVQVLSAEEAIPFTEELS